MKIKLNNNKDEIIDFFFRDIIDTLEETLESPESKDAFYEGFDTMKVTKEVLIHYYPKFEEIILNNYD